MNDMDSNDCWGKEDRNHVLDYLKPNLWRYLFREALPDLEYSIEKLTGLTLEEQDILKKAHFPLSAEVGELVDILPQIMRNLSHSTQKEVIESRGGIRGGIDWSLTFKERFGRGYNDPSLFICKPALKMYDLPENQLLKFILWKIRKLSEHTGFLPEISDEILEKEVSKNWQEIIIKRYFEVRKALKHIYFQNISIPRIIRPKTVQRAKNHKNRLYEKVVECYNSYKKIFITEDQETLKELIEKQILEPLNDDKLFEIFVLFKILENFEDEEGDLEFGLLIPGKEYIAQYTNEDKIIRVFYQQVPVEFRNSSEYKKILKCYDLGFSSRLPDIILEIEYKNTRFYLIIEIKRTVDKNYILDSVYKVLGYFSDFKDCFEDEKNPKAVLVVWGGINIKDLKAVEKSILIVPHHTLNQKLQALNIF